MGWEGEERDWLCCVIVGQMLLYINYLLIFVFLYNDSKEFGVIFFLGVEDRFNFKSIITQTTKIIKWKYNKCIELAYVQ